MSGGSQREGVSRGGGGGEGKGRRGEERKREEREEERREGRRWRGGETMKVRKNRYHDVSETWWGVGEGGKVGLIKVREDVVGVIIERVEMCQDGSQKGYGQGCWGD